MSSDNLPEPLDPLQQEANAMIGELLYNAVDKLKFAQWLFHTGRLAAAKSGTPPEKLEEAMEQEIVETSLGVLMTECYNEPDETMDLLKLTNLAALVYTRAARALAAQIAGLYDPSRERYDSDNPLKI
jgi:hypothetical protein